MAEALRSPTKAPGLLRKDDMNRRGLSKSENATTPITPPARYISSNFSTPGSIYGKEEDAIIIELTPRYLKAGIEGESHPQCRFDFNPSNTKRLGDYRQWLPGYTLPKESLDTWGAGYELWRNDLKGVDLGLLSDKLERAVREVYTKHLLVDAGNSRLVLVMPSLLPLPALSTILQTFFERWTYPSITLLPSPATALISAGLRSGLVVEVGWEETVVTAVYEYREVRSQRSNRAMKMLTRNFAEWAQGRLEPNHRLDLETVESFIKRAVNHVYGSGQTHSTEASVITVDWPTGSFIQSVTFSKDEIRLNLTETLLGKDDEQYPDDEETPLQHLIYKTLLALPPDVRGLCVSRMAFIGEGSEVQGLQHTVVDAFSKLLTRRGWTEAQGQKQRRKREGLSEMAQTKVQPADARHEDIMLADKAIAEERYLREKAKHIQPVAHGAVRPIDSLGCWAGASLLTSLKVKSFVEIQRDRFLSHGLGGASRDVEVSMVPQQKPPTLGIRPKAGERTSWTLSGWG